MKRFDFLYLLLFIPFIMQSQTLHKVYLIPGQGADERLFSGVCIEGCETTVLKFLTPFRNETLPEYARRMSEQIDTSKSFSLVGVSLGGMIAVEMSKFLQPEKVVLISSAKGRDELPMRYRFMTHVPLYRLFPGSLLKKLANIARPVVEPESRTNTPVFKAMINDKDPLFMQRSIHMIVNWQNTKHPLRFVHIHGTKDKTIPFRNIGSATAIKGGGHMITLTRIEEINQILDEELSH